jgi:DNA (cytosine-5)-methyltransferase 1
MRFGSVCSGIEAASCAWHPLGWKTAFVSEIEPFPCSVLAHHYPTVPNLGDMTKFKEWGNYDIDVLVGGTPCQSFSVAGLRKGLADPRGNLMLTYLAIADQYRPRWLVWENVPGVLSSNSGKDFGTFLGGLGELGYGFAYRVLDAQHFGVPQRRRRVFVVGCLGDWRRAAAVLFERHSLQGNPAPIRQTRKDVAPTLSARTKGGGGLGTDFECDGGLIAHSLRGEGFDASEDSTGRGTPLVPVQKWPAEVSSTLNAAFGTKLGLENQHINEGAPLFVPARALAFDCKASGQSGFGVGEVASTMRAMGHVNTHQNGGGHLAVASFKAGQGAAAGGIGYSEHVSPTLGAADSGSNRTPSLMHGMQVRRLTPLECERLQGFADDYTLVQHRGKPAADGPRYKALGNSMAVPVMRWIGERIQAVDAIRLDEVAA